MISGLDARQAEQEMAMETYQCAQCPKTFPSRGSQHLKTHSKPFQCEHCPKRFALRLDVQRHVRAKHRVGQPLFPCSHAGCRSKFSRKDNLQQHIKQRHSNASLMTTEIAAPDEQHSHQHSTDMATTVPKHISGHQIKPSVILQAVSLGNLSMFELAVGCGAALSIQGDDGSNAMHCAARSGHATAVKRLLDLGCPSDALNSKRRTPLHEAIISQDAETVSAVLGSNPDLQSQDCQGKSAIEHAMEQPNQEIPLLLLSQLSIEQMNSGDLAILHLAAKYQRSAFIEKFLTIPGVQANGRDRKWKTPLHMASLSGNEGIVAQLLSREEVDVNAKAMPQGHGGKTPLYYAAKKGHEEVVKRLLTSPGLEIRAYGFNLTPVGTALQNGHPSIAERLLYDDRHRFSTSKQVYTVRDRQRSFDEAVRMGYSRIVKGLLKDPVLYVNESAWARDGCALQVAVENNNMEILESLLQHPDILVNKTVWYRRGSKSCSGTALHRGAELGYLEATRLLLQHEDINPNLQGSAGNTPLHCALLNDHIEVAKLLLIHERLDFRRMEPARDEYGSVIDKNQEETALQIATRKGQTEIIELLMARDDINPPTKPAEEQPLAVDPMDISYIVQPEPSSVKIPADPFESYLTKWLYTFEDTSEPIGL